MLAAGTTLGPYKILAPLGAGGMGEVYRARDTRLGRDVAIKVIHAEVARDPDRIKRFEQEARATSALSHPNVCAIYDIGSYEGSPFVVMELLEGESLREKLRAGALPVRKAIDYAAQAAHGLAAAHEKGIIHRDLKPENLFVTKDGRVKVLDFGLAKLTRPEMVAAAGEPTVSIAATETGAILGTVGYMSPEQVRGEAADARSDLFALGAILYEMLSGRRAFHGETYVETLSAILKEDPAPLAISGHEAAPTLEPIIRRCLEKSPAERFQNASDLAFDLEAIGSGPMRGMAVPAAGRPRLRAVWIAAAAGVVLLGAGIWMVSGPLSHLLGGRQTIAGQSRDWILVADFESAREDSTLAAAARSLISAALDQSELVATVPSSQIRLALQQAGKPAGTRVTGEVARELAYRRAVRAVLEGEIARLGKGFSLTLRVVDAESLKVVLTERASAKDEDDLIPTLGEMAKRLRRGLGEHRAAIAATRPMTAAATPSFDAYKLYLTATDLFQSGDYEGAIALYREALRLDPGFAGAWINIGLANNNLGRADSVRVAFEHATSQPDRLGQYQRLLLEAASLSDGGDALGAMTVYMRMVKLNPSNLYAWNALGLHYHNLGRFAEALAQYREVERRSPLRVNPLCYVNQAEALLSLGRIDQAREVAGRIQGPISMPERTNVELAEGNWAAAESLSAFRSQDLSVPAVHRRAAIARMAIAQAGRGSIRSAAAALVGMRSQVQGQGQRALECGRVLIFLAAETGRAIALPPESWAGDGSAGDLLFLGLRAAAAGVAAAARRYQQKANARPAREMIGQGASPALLAAHIAASTGRWDEVIGLLRPVASQAVEIGGDETASFVIAVPAARCLLADAFEAVGQPDSAAAYLERMTTDPATWCHWGGISWPIAHRRLVLLYTRTGRLADAERRLAVLERWWDRPDDVARRMLDEARAAVQSARGMARPERPRA